MRIAFGLFVMSAAFAWLTVNGRIQLHQGGAAPPAIVLDRSTAPGPSSTGRTRLRLAVPRGVEQAFLHSFTARGKQAVQP